MITIEMFAAGLWECFRRMRKINIETYGKFSESVKKMSEEELMKLDWELSIADIFIITHCCRLYLTDERICNETLDIFHGFVYNDFSQIDKMLAYTFQEESKVKYQIFFDTLRSENSLYSLSKKLGENIYDREVLDAIELNALRVYVEANFRYMTNFIGDILKKFEIKTTQIQQRF